MTNEKTILNDLVMQLSERKIRESKKLIEFAKQSANIRYESGFVDGMNYAIQAIEDCLIELNK